MLAIHPDEQVPSVRDAIEIEGASPRTDSTPWSRVLDKRSIFVAVSVLDRDRDVPVADGAYSVAYRQAWSRTGTFDDSELRGLTICSVLVPIIFIIVAPHEVFYVPSTA